MAFKGKTTTGYKSTTGKQLGGAKTRGQVSHNPRKPLPGGRTNIVTKATRTGSNPRNTRIQTQNSNRVQRAGGPKTNPKQIGLGRAAMQPAASARGKNSMSKSPFKGYNHLTNSRQVPAGRGNIRNAGTVTNSSVARIKSASLSKMPKGAIQGGGSFGKFIGK